MNMGLAEAKELVSTYITDIKSKGYQPNLVDINHLLGVLRNYQFYVTVDGTDKVIKEVMLNLNGEITFNTFN